MILLSDGMGTGHEAAEDSVLAIRLLGQLLRGGFDPDAALHITNTALLLRSAQESLVTVDAAQIDLYTGTAELCKSGAAPTFYRKKGRAQMLESRSLPAGIVGGIEPARQTLQLGDGDMLLLVSDGVTASGTDWVLAELEQGSGLSAEEMAQRIAEQAHLRRIDGYEDDITVLCCRLEKGI